MIRLFTLSFVLFFNHALAQSSESQTTPLVGKLKTEYGTAENQNASALQRSASNSLSLTPFFPGAEPLSGTARANVGIFQWVQILPAATSRLTDAQFTQAASASGLFDVVIRLPRADWAEGLAFDTLITSTATGQGLRPGSPNVQAPSTDPNRHQWWFTQANFQEALQVTHGRATVGAVDGRFNFLHPDLTGHRKPQKMMAFFRDNNISPLQYSANATLVLGQGAQDAACTSAAPNIPYLRPRACSSASDHGEMVSGVLAARVNNNINTPGFIHQGMAGGCPSCDIAWVNTAPSLYSVPLVALSNNLGATVVNLSLSTTRPELYDPNLDMGTFDAFCANADVDAVNRDAVETANRMDTVVVAAFGNGDNRTAVLCTDLARPPRLFPSPGALPGVFGVSGTSFAPNGQLPIRWTQAELYNRAPNLRPTGGFLATNCSRQPTAVNPFSSGEGCGSNYGFFNSGAGKGPYSNRIFGPKLAAPASQILLSLSEIYISPQSCINSLNPLGHACFSEDNLSLFDTLNVGPAIGSPWAGNSGLLGSVVFPDLSIRSAVTNATLDDDVGMATFPNTPYRHWGVASGTSFSAPMVTATVGLIRSVNPLLPTRDVEDALRTSATNGADWSDRVLNAGKAVKAVLGKINNVVPKNRAIPLFIATNQNSTEWIQTTSPQQMTAAAGGNLFRILNANGSPNNVGTLAPAVYRGENLFNKVGASIDSLYTLPLGNLQNPTQARSTVLVLSTEVSPTNIPLLPLHRFSTRCFNGPRRFTWATSLPSGYTAIEPATPPNCQLNNISLTSHFYDGVEGYVFSSQEVGTEALNLYAVNSGQANENHLLLTPNDRQKLSLSGINTVLLSQSPLGFAHPLAGYPNNGDGIILDNDLDGLPNGFELVMGLDMDHQNSDLCGGVDVANDAQEYPFVGLPVTDPLLCINSVSAPIIGPSPSVVNEPVNFISSFDSSGSVEVDFYEISTNGTQIYLCTGVKNFFINSNQRTCPNTPAFVFTSAGAKRIQARLRAIDSPNAPPPAVSPIVIHQVLGIATELSFDLISPSPVLVSQPYSVTVRVTAANGIPSGSIVISEGQNQCSTILTLMPDGRTVGTCSLTSNLLGTRQITASYAGNTAYSPAQATSSQFVEIGVQNIRLSQVSCSGQALGPVLWNSHLGAVRYEIEQRTSLLPIFWGDVDHSTVATNFTPITSSPLPPDSGVFDTLLKIRACTKLRCGVWSQPIVYPIGGDQCG